MPHVPGHILINVPLNLVLSQAAVDRLTILKDAYNAENATNLALAGWVELHLRELAISREWSASVQAQHADLERAQRDAVADERARLLGTV